MPEIIGRDAHAILTLRRRELCDALGPSAGSGG